MALPYQETPVAEVPQTDNFDQWRIKTNQAIARTNDQEVKIGDLNTLVDPQESLVDAVNSGRQFSIAITLALA
jgi:hypothetical protein